MFKKLMISVALLLTLVLNLISFMPGAYAATPPYISCNTLITNLGESVTISYDTGDYNTYRHIYDSFDGRVIYHFVHGAGSVTYTPQTVGTHVIKLIDPNTSQSVCYSTSFTIKAVPIVITKKLPVPQFSQYALGNYNNLCWATCAAMVVAYYNNNTTNLTVEIAKDKFGQQNYNQTAYIWDVKAAIQKFANRYGSYANSPLAFDMVKSQIDYGAPIVCMITNGISADGHVVLITGYKTSTLNNEVTKYVIYTDPQDGRSYEENYTSFVNKWKENLTF